MMKYAFVEDTCAMICQEFMSMRKYLLLRILFKNQFSPIFERLSRELRQIHMNISHVLEIIF